MKAREKRNITIDIHVNGEYCHSTKRNDMTAKQAINLGQTIAKNYARGNQDHVMIFVHFGELAVADMTARTELDNHGRKHIELNKRIYNI